MSTFMFLKHWFFLFLAFLALLILLLGSRLQQADYGDIPHTQPPSVALITATANKSISITHHYTGVLQPRLHSALGFEVSGLLKEILVDQGQSLTSGQILAHLDTALLQQQIRQAEARRQEIEAHIHLAKLNLNRSQSLEKKQLSSTQNRDEAEAALAIAQAQLAAQQARLAELRLLLEKNTLKAPYAGVVSTRHLDAGAVVNPGQPIVTIESIDGIEVHIGLPHQVIEQLSTEKIYDFVFHQQKISGTWQRTLPQTRQQLLQTAIFVLDRAESLPRDALISLIFYEEIQEDNFKVPLTALKRDRQGLWTVLVAEAAAEGYRLQARLVEVLHFDEQNAWLHGDLAEGELVVSAGRQYLVSGQQVQP